ncbi:hypothetical protein [Tuwongella immobilis]|uniref:Uncharacterized protein n=1 Tax=Tuwongella immobilis TaxID=692036 RepID=A0A6C2YGM5_9BACT|nr:hypothetical protein [Tuwongella immobilis]VIP00670.1 unnamed protein product [Tuwongella immobilis]VTR96758.1 unnamed protein product [Tuwongella immobilis]
MKRITMILAALVVMTSFGSEAKAEYPPADFRSGVKHDIGQTGSPYGSAPFFRKLFSFSWKKSGCSTCSDCEGGVPAGYGMGRGPVGPMPGQGTLVFPNHPFARSPRDFFMED